MSELSLALVAGLLRRGRDLDRLSSALTLLAVGLGFFQLLLGGGWRFFSPLMLFVALLGLSQKYWALRVAFDAELFERLAVAGEALEVRTCQLDLALIELRLVVSNKFSRPWAERSRGALRLLRWQTLACAAQVLMALLCLLLVSLLTVRS